MIRARTHRRLPPEQQKLLRSSKLGSIDRHAGFGAVRVGGNGRNRTRRRMSDARLEQHEGDRSDAASIRLDGTVAPFVFPVEAAVLLVNIRAH